MVSPPLMKLLMELFSKKQLYRWSWLVPNGLILPKYKKICVYYFSLKINLWCKWKENLLHKLENVHFREKAAARTPWLAWTRSELLMLSCRSPSSHSFVPPNSSSETALKKTSSEKSKKKRGGLIFYTGPNTYCMSVLFLRPKASYT
jgi:hypothetical protein